MGVVRRRPTQAQALVACVFTDDHAARLAREGLTPEQIDAVESVLGRCRHELRKAPATNSVRGVIAPALQSIHEAAQQLQAILSADEDREPAAYSLLDEWGPAGRVEDALNNALPLLLRAGAVLQQVDAKVADRGRVDRNEASPYPAYLIHRALGTSFKKSSSRFAVVVGVCYEAIGRAGRHEGGLKKYIETPQRDFPLDM